MNYSNRYKNLDELGISSDEEAEELEYELDLRFVDFTPEDRKTWLRQSAYLEHFSRTGTISSAAEKAGVTAYTAQGWQYDNALGFTRRDEVASLIFTDRLKETALLRASDPKAPATLLIELLRAYIPEEFSRNGHKCDSSKSDELLRRYSEDARRDLEAGQPGLRKLAEGAENAYPEDDWPTEPDAYPDDNYHTDMNDYPAEPVSSDDLDPSGSHPISPPPGERHREGVPHTQHHTPTSHPTPTVIPAQERHPVPRYGTGIHKTPLCSLRPLRWIPSRLNGEFPTAPSDASDSDNKERPKRRTPSP